MADDEFADDKDPYEVFIPESGTISDDGSGCLFIWSGRSQLSFVVPSEYLFPLAALSLEAANRAHAIAGNLANQQTLQSEAVEVYSDSDHVDLHFRLTGMNTDLPISITRKTASWLLEQLAASLAKGAAPPSGHLQ